MEKVNNYKRSKAIIDVFGEEFFKTRKIKNLTFEECDYLCLNVKNRTELFVRFNSVYRHMQKNGWLDIVYPLKEVA